MNPSSDMDLTAWIGSTRVLDPAGALPQPAQRLDASGPLRDTEIEIDVETLCLDATSFRQISEEAAADAAAMASRIEEIVASRGKMHNPVTRSGGVLLGTVRAVGADHPSPPSVGQRIVCLASLTLIPLRLDGVGPVGETPQVPVSGTAYLNPSLAWAPMPEDLPTVAAVDLFDVCAAASHTRELVKAGDTVCVLGTGHAGKLVLAAARDALGGTGQVVAVDASPAALRTIEAAGLCDTAVCADLRDAVAAVQQLRDAGVPPADVTVVVVSATDCEPAAILMTADTGSILFFSMATSFSVAALTSDGLGSTARMVIGSGYSPDHGEYALGLVRESPALRAAFVGAEGDR
jgi:L-erythro-3,5-diaminohexanoate dehydrogenase